MDDELCLNLSIYISQMFSFILWLHYALSITQSLCLMEWLFSCFVFIYFPFNMLCIYKYIYTHTRTKMLFDSQIDIQPLFGKSNAQIFSHGFWHFLFGKLIYLCKQYCSDHYYISNVIIFTEEKKKSKSFFQLLPIFILHCCFSQCWKQQNSSCTISTV